MFESGLDVSVYWCMSLLLVVVVVVVVEVVCCCCCCCFVCFWFGLEKTKDVPLVEFMYLVFTCIPGESYRR